MTAFLPLEASALSRVSAFLNQLEVEGLLFNGRLELFRVNELGHLPVFSTKSEKPLIRSALLNGVEGGSYDGVGEHPKLAKAPAEALDQKVELASAEALDQRVGGGCAGKKQSCLGEQVHEESQPQGNATSPTNVAEEARRSSERTVTQGRKRVLEASTSVRIGERRALTNENDRGGGRSVSGAQQGLDDGVKLDGSPTKRQVCNDEKLVKESFEVKKHEDSEKSQAFVSDRLVEASESTAVDSPPRLKPTEGGMKRKDFEGLDAAGFPVQKVDLYTQLLTIMGAVFHDYDFSAVKPSEAFRCCAVRSLVEVYSAINQQLSVVEENNAGFLSDLWKAIRGAVDLKEAEVYAYQGSNSGGGEGDPFLDGQEEESLDSFHYFFVDRARSRVLAFSCVTMSKPNNCEVNSSNSESNASSDGGSDYGDDDEDYDDDDDEDVGDESLEGDWSYRIAER